VITEPEHVSIQHEYVTDATYLSRMARTFTAFSVSRPVFVWIFGLLGIVGVVCIVVGAVSEQPAFALAGFFYLACIPSMVLVTYRRTTRGNAHRLPPGSRLVARLDPETLHTEGPMGTSDSSYRVYKAVYRRGDFVILQNRGIRIYALLPIELFPDGDFVRLREAIAKANS
jgi:hypothetical protein